MHFDYPTILKQILDELRSFQPFIVLPTPGNAGDALINCTTYQLLRRMGIAFEILPGNCDPATTRNRVVLFATAGNLIPHYTDAQSFIAAHHAGARKLILLPGTIRKCDHLLAQLGNNVVVMCRDRKSYDYVARAATGGASVVSTDDSALSLDPVELLESNASLAAYLAHQRRRSNYHLRLALSDAVRWYRILTVHTIKRSWRRQHLIAIFRNDVEKTTAPPADNVDISAYLEGGDMSEMGARITSYRFLKFLSLFDEIHTNRLHAAIGGLILGKRVHLFDNSYGKNEAIYWHSLHSRYPGRVSLHTADERAELLTNTI